MKKFLLIVFVVICSSVSSRIYASHVMGADLTFACLGPNQYLVTLQVYRDCNGIALNGPLTINYSSATCGVNSTLTLNQVGSPTDITPVCFAGTDACNGGSGYGIQKYIFQGTLTLPPGCGADWVLSWTLCCRNAAITTLANPGSENLYIEADLNNTLPTCDSSPTFSNDPIAIYCTNFPQQFNHGATDANGDSLYFYLMPSLNGPGSSVAYNSGYGATNPLATTSGTTINGQTGQLSFTPSQTQVAVMKVGVNEYRNGVLIGHIERDMQVIVTNCTNSAPTANGINGQTGATANTYTTTACSNTCFTIQTADASTTDSVFYTWLGTNLPGATITSSGGQKPLLTICWAPTQNDVGTHNFVLNLKNNDCPYYGTAAIAYTVIVNPASDPPVNAGPDVHLCPGQSTTLTATSAGSVTSYTWSDGINTQNGATWTVNPTITTVYTVTAVYANGCQLTDQVVVYRDVPPRVSAFPLLTTLCSTSDSVQLSAFSSDPTSTFTWSPASGLTCTNCANPKASPPATSTYTLTTTDSAGCPSAPVSVTVELAPPPPSQSCAVIYASPTGTGNGTQSSPASLQAAIDSAACNNAVIKMAIGTYTIDNPITNITSYTTLEGGFDPANDWRKTSQPGATIIYRSALNMEGLGTNNARIVAIYMNGNDYFRFQDVTIQTANCPALATGDTYGYSNYALHLTNCSNYNLTRCQLLPGTATGGAAGPAATGTGGAPGTPGTGGAGGAGNPNTGCNLSGTAGTAGTASSTGAGGGAAGGAGTGTGCNTAGCGVDATNGGAGGTGVAGAAGTTPATPASPGTTTTFFNVAGQSASGTAGGAGGGGGGGGGGQNGTNCFCNINGSANGGAGGTGGTGGLGGGGGYGGGGVFGLYLFNNGAGGTIVDCNIAGNTPGPGGIGGAGQPPGAFSTGASGSSTSGSCSPQSTGGRGGDGGAGGTGGTGATGAPGVTAEIVSNGTAPTYTAGGVATTINTGINNPTPFNLAAQTIIYAANVNCTNRNDTLSTATSGAWTTGAGASVASGSGTQIITQYLSTGRKNIGYNGSTYTGFVNMAIDQTTFVPVIQSSASVLHGDTFYVCQGSTATFDMQIASADTFDWNFGGATVPNIYMGHNFQNLPNLTFNTAGTFMILARIETSCCGWSPYDTAYLLVEPSAALTYTGATAFCAGDSAHIILTGTGVSYQWSPTAGISNPTGTNVYAYPQATTTYLVTSYSPRGLCNADTSITITKNLPATVTFTTVAASCGSIGSATANATPAGSYTYLWSPGGQTTATISNQPSGTYYVTVTPVGSDCSVAASTSIGTNGGLQAYFTTSISPLCNGQCTGEVKVEALGGQAPYSYHWSSGSSTLDSLVNQCAGSYTVTITDANSCTASATQVLSQPLPLSVAVLDSSSPHCAGQCTGSAKVDGQGGTGPYSFIWSAPSTSDSSHAINLCAGQYTVNCIDNNGCRATGTVTITTPPPFIEDTISTKDVSCFGGSDGDIILSVVGGTYPYTYSWPQLPSVTDSIANSLAAGTYTPIVTDFYGCRDSLSVVITQPALLVPAISQLDSISCHGLTDGSVTITATGGTTPYTYSLDATGTFQSSGTFTGLTSGPHQVTVQDANLCNSIITFNIFEPTVFTASITTTINDSCFNECAGIIIVSVSGGVPPYYFAINGGAYGLSDTFGGLCANPSYTITARDNHGCAAAPMPDAITQPASSVSLTFGTASPPTCNNGTNGSFTVSASGGTPGYTFSSDNGPYQTSTTFSPQAAGPHLVTARDAWGCTDTLTVAVPNPPPSSFYATVDTNVLCFGGDNGSVTLTLTGTTTPYSYTWSANAHGATGTRITGLTAGTYIVTVVDGNGCIVYSADSINIITQPTQVGATDVMVPVSCFGGSDGSITVTDTGGVAPYTNSWSNGSTSTTISALPIGQYSDTITDAHGCQYIDANITVTQPTPVGIYLDSTVVVSCLGDSNGAIYLTGTGGTPGYTYTWTPAATGSPLQNVKAGSYTVTVSDSHNCTDTMTVTVGTAPPMSITADKSNVLCPPLHNGRVTLTVSGGSPAYSFQWNNGATTNAISGLPVGIDSVIVTDARGCSIDTSFIIRNDSSFKVKPVPDTAIINEGDQIPLALDITTAPGDQVSAISWVPTYSLSCSDCLNPLASPVNTTDYIIHLVSDSGCVLDTAILITVIPQHQLYVPNAFTPNGNGVNDYWEIFGYEKAWKKVEVEIFDRWGEKIYQSTEIGFQWDGKYRGQLVEPGVYVYILNVTFIDGYTVKNKGSISLIR